MRQTNFKIVPPSRQSPRTSFAGLLVGMIAIAFAGGIGVQRYLDSHAGSIASHLADVAPVSSVAKIVGSNSIVKDSATIAPSTTYPKCYGSAAQRIDCIVDGDTLWVHGVKIRVADIDAPEISKPRCQYEADLGAKATNRFQQLVNAGPFELQAWPGRDEDQYGRKLRVLVRNGHSLGDTLVSEGLARRWSGRREPWC